MNMYIIYIYIYSYIMNMIDIAQLPWEVPTQVPSFASDDDAADQTLSHGVMQKCLHEARTSSYQCAVNSMVNVGTIGKP